MNVVQIPRDVFLDRYLDLKRGEHVALIGPTGTGKTTLGLDIMNRALTLNPRTQGLVLAMKPHRKGKLRVRVEQGGTRYRTGDETVARLAMDRDKAKVIRSWPPVKSFFAKPSYYVLWPEHQFDPDVDDPAHYAIFRRAILDAYKRGDWWVFADEVYGLSHDLDLETELRTIWSRGRSMDTGMIAATQKPTHVGTWIYSQSSHLFLWYDGDQRARQRYAQISGVNPRTIIDTIDGLRGRDCLYVHVPTKTLCIVTAT